MKNITPILFELIQNRKTKIAKRVHDNVLQRDKVMVTLDDDGKTFYIERVNSMHTIPNYARDYIIRLLERKGFNYYMNN